MAQQLEFPPRQSHRHTVDRASVFPFNHFMRECYNTPEGVYDTAKRRGMDLVTVTDHDRISGALAIADRPDVLVGCEVTAEFADADLCVVRFGPSALVGVGLTAS